jgi:hypothetical protein
VQVARKKAKQCRPTGPEPVACTPAASHQLCWSVGVPIACFLNVPLLLGADSTRLRGLKAGGIRENEKQGPKAAVPQAGAAVGRFGRLGPVFGKIGTTSLGIGFPAASALKVFISCQQQQVNSSAGSGFPGANLTLLSFASRRETLWAARPMLKMTYAPRGLVGVLIRRKSIPQRYEAIHQLDGLRSKAGLGNFGAREMLCLGRQTRRFSSDGCVYGSRRVYVELCGLDGSSGRLGQNNPAALMFRQNACHRFPSSR